MDGASHDTQTVTVLPNRRYRKRMETWLDIAAEEGVNFFLTSLGKPDWVAKRAHADGGGVYSVRREWSRSGGPAALEFHTRAVIRVVLYG